MAGVAATGRRRRPRPGKARVPQHEGRALHLLAFRQAHILPQVAVLHAKGAGLRVLPDDGLAAVGVLAQLLAARQCHRGPRDARRDDAIRPTAFAAVRSGIGEPLVLIRLAQPGPEPQVHFVVLGAFLHGDALPEPALALGPDIFDVDVDGLTILHGQACRLAARKQVAALLLEIDLELEDALVTGEALPARGRRPRLLPPRMLRGLLV
mmetsp:Transcript_6955/g.19647  ORF Transcript_6955/g.19647 Transcript_6955/m.19647 type:complete len:209 (+) Transcript_6955:1614-2240(+)